MKFLAMAESLKTEFSVDVLSISNPDVSSIKFYDKSQARAKANSIAVGSYNELHNCSDFNNENHCFIMYNVPDGARNKLIGSNTVIVDSAPQIKYIVNHIMDLLARESQCANVDSISHYYEAESLEMLLNLMAEQLCNPVLLMDLHCNILLSAEQKFSREDPALCMFYDERLCNDRFKYDIERIHKGIIYTHPIDDHYTTRICPVFFDSSPAAILVEIAADSNIDPAYNTFFESIAKIIEKRFSKDKVFTAKTKARPMADAYYKLLCGEHQDYFGGEFLEGKFDNDYHQFIVACRLPESTESLVKLLDSFENIPFTSAFVYKEFAVAVTRVCTSCYSMLRKRWKQLSLENNIDISVSEPFTGLKRLKRFFNEAVTALSYADIFRKTGDEKVVCYYDDCRFFESMKRIPYTELIDKYCAPALHAVLKHDAINGTEYFKSLRAFVFNDRNYKAAAAELNIHNNTMYYRISQIEKIYYDQTIWDPDFFFTMSYSFRLYDYCQMRINSMPPQDTTAKKLAYKN